MNRDRKKELVRIAVSVLLLVIGEAAPLGGNISPVFFICAYITAGYDTVIKAFRNIAHGHMFDEHFLMTVATAGAFALGQWDEASGVMIFFLTGLFFENLSADRSRRSISDLMDIRPDHANLLKDGAESRVDPSDVSPGDIIIIRPGEKIPLDGIVTEGLSFLDTSSLTGESIPVSVMPGDSVTSGCINMNALIKAKVTAGYEDSTVARILDLIENAGSKKSRSERFITCFARYYTPAVVLAAALLAILPPLIMPGQTFATWIYRALLFLIVSCPCALVISVPLSFFGGIVAASRSGILIKGSNYLENFSKINTMIFDKTGTLTSGEFEVTYVHSEKMDTFQLLNLAGALESYSNHPLSKCLKKACGDPDSLSDVEELPGRGIRGRKDGIAVYAGNENLMNSLGYFQLPSDEYSTLIHLASEDEYYGYIAVSDTLKSDAKQTIQQLKESGVEKTVMLTGDRRVISEKTAAETGIDEFHSELLPGEKIAVTEKIISMNNVRTNRHKGKGTVAFAGDGINDAPVLARADIGIAVGGMGSATAIEAADIVIMDDQLSKLPKTIDISKKTLAIARENIVFTLLVKAAVMILGAVGIATMWAAVSADAGVSVIAILNSMRMMIMHK